MADAKNAVEHNRDQYRRQTTYSLQDDIREDIELCSRAIEDGGRENAVRVLERIRSSLLPNVSRYGDRSWGEYDRRLRDVSNWYWSSLSTFIDDTGRLHDILKSAPPRSQRYQKALVVLERTLASLTAVAEDEDIILDEYASKVDAVGFSGTTIGQHLQDEELDIGNPVDLITDRSGAVKTLHAGGTGQGKSTGLEREVEDYYLQTFAEGRDYKIMDLVGLRDGENWFYDIPQQQDELTQIRQEMDLPEGLEADNGDLEILVPLTPELTDHELPYDTADERFVVRPFTVPASEIRKELMVAILTAKLTDQQEAAIRNAYAEVDHSQTDWSLSDLADEIKRQDDVPPEKRESIVTTLSNLQRQGFIRTHDDPYTLDWDDLFRSPETITVFSQATMATDPIARLIAFGYLAHTVATKRAQMHSVPDVVVVMRELWKVAPHQRRQHFDTQAASLQEAIGHMFSEVFRENRHSGIHIQADTQQPSDLLKPVREMFNRYVVYNTNQSQVKDIFEWTANDKWRSFYNTLTPTPGEASVVGMVGPAIEERNIEFVGPVQYAPPSHHHRDADVDRTGWHARTKYRENEQLRTPTEMGIDWDAAVPEGLDVSTETEDAKPDPEIKPVKAFVHECVEYDQDSAVIRDDLKAAFNAFAQDHGHDAWDFSDQAVSTRFGTRLNKIIEGDIGQTSRNGEEAYNYLRLTDIGEQYLDDDMSGLADSSEPIRTDA